jgi:hypothetical protein
MFRLNDEVFATARLYQLRIRDGILSPPRRLGFFEPAGNQMRGVRHFVRGPRS